MFQHGPQNLILFKNYLDRPRLIIRLNSFSNAPLILLSAPAGYGKTTLVNAWLERLHTPVAWLSLGPNENELSSFLRHLTGAVRRPFPNSLYDTYTLSEAILSPSIEVITRTLVNDLTSLGREFILVLDNYEFIRNREIHELMNVLLEYGSPPAHILMCTRFEPPVSMASLRARSLMGEIKAEELRFDQEEETSFLSLAEGRSDRGSLMSIAAEMEGWPAGLSLLVSAACSTPEHEPATLRERTMSYISDYLDTEVLARLDPLFRNLVLRMSVLNRFNADLCNFIFKDVTTALPFTGGTALIKRLKRENMFISPLNGSGWHRFHPVFQQVIAARAGEQLSSEELEQVHSSTADWLNAHGLPGDMLLHARRLPVRQVYNLFRCYRYDLIGNGNWRALRDWLELFPDSLIDSLPDLLLAKVWLMLAYLRLPDSSVILETIGDVFLTSKAEIADYRIELALLRTALLLKTGNFRQALESLPDMPEESQPAYKLKNTFIALRIEAERLASQTTPRGDSLREQGYSSVSASNYRETINLLSCRCADYVMNASFTDARKTAAVLWEIALKHEDPGFTGKAGLYLGVSAYQQNDLQSARENAAEVVHLAEFLDTDTSLAAFLLLAETEQALGHPEEAERTIAILRTHLASLNNLDLFPVLEIFEMELALRAGLPAYEMPPLLPDFNLMYMRFVQHPSLTLCHHVLVSKSVTEYGRCREVLTILYECASASRNKLLQIQVTGQLALLAKAENDLKRGYEYLQNALELAKPGKCLRAILDCGPDMARLIRESSISPVGIVSDLLDAFSREELTFISPSPKLLFGHLTSQEIRVLGYLRRRLSNKEIAEQLTVTPATVKSHTIHIYQKLNAGNRRDAVEKAARLGLFQA